MPRPIRYQPDAARRVLILTNPTAGSGTHRHAINQLRDHLCSDGMQVEITSDLDQVAHEAAHPASADLRAVVAAGGDGTVGEVVNRTLPGTSIAILPLGTENLLAKYLHMLAGPRELGRAIVHGATVRVDAGRAAGRIFVLMAGCGFDADVVQRLHATRTGNIRHLAYVKPILDSLRRYKYPLLHVECEGVVNPYNRQATAAPDLRQTFDVRWLFVVNLPRYAGGLQFVPQAVGTDGLLDICGFESGSWSAGLRYLTGVLRHRHLTWPDCHYVQAKKVRIWSEDDVLYQLDGDPGGSIPVEITVLPARISLIVSENWAVQHGFRHQARGVPPAADAPAANGHQATRPN